MQVSKLFRFSPTPIRSHQTPQANVRPVSAPRVGIITQFFPPDYAPTGQLLDELSQQLEAQGFQIEIFTSQPGYAFQDQSAPRHEQIRHRSIRRSRTASIWPQRIRGKAVNGLLFCLRAGLHLIKLAKRSDIILVTTAPPFLPILGYLIRHIFKKPYICLLYDLYPDIAINLGVIHPDHWIARLWSAVNYRIWKDADRIIVLSSTMRDRVLDRHPTLAPKTSVIHSWADPNWIIPIEKHRNWFAWKHHLVESFTVLYSGNMGRCHDIETLLQAAQLLKHDPIKFVIIGSGARYKILKETVAEQGLDNFRFLPYQEKHDLPHSLTACDLSLVSVSPGMEGLVAPSKLYAALASGRPVAAICEPHSYLTGLIANAECGAAFQNGDAQGLASFIRFLSHHPQQTHRLGQAGRHYLKSHFTPEIIAYQYAEAFGSSLLPSSVSRQSV
ncbi:MAG TPA: glycosyltransferase family 4 protein, partial [Elainellaceae cyanobacterium]